MSPTQSIERRAITTSDHDLLVTLNTKFEIFVKAYAEDMKDLKDGVSTKIADHEIRLTAVEKIVEQVRPLETYKDFIQLKSEWHDSKVKLGVMRWVTGIISAGIMFLLTQVPNVLRAWGLIK